MFYFPSLSRHTTKLLILVIIILPLIAQVERSVSLIKLIYISDFLVIC